MLLAALAALFGFQLTMPVNHDAAWVLEGAERLFDGAVFGRTVIDVTPPLAWWLVMPVIAAHKLAGLPIGPLFKLYVGGLAVLSLWVSHRMLLTFPDKRETAAAITAVTGAILLFAGGYDFGQREHLMLILALPYVYLAAARVSGTAVSAKNAVAAGLLAAGAFLLKPHFLAIPAALEIWLLCRRFDLRGVFRVETIVLAGGGLLYAVAIWAFAWPYVSEILPRAMLNYGAYSNSFLDAVLSYAITAMPVLIALFLVRLCGPWRENFAATAFLLAGAGASVSAIAQSKGWSYHLLPVTGFWAIAGALLIIPAWGRVDGKAKARLAVAAVALAWVVLRPSAAHLRDAWSPHGNAAAAQRLVSLIETNGGAGTGVMAFNTSPRVIHSAILRADARWIAPACCLHFLPAGVNGQDGSVAARKRRGIALEQMDSVLADIERHKPRILIVNAGEPKLAFPEPFNYIAWFAETYPRRFAAIQAHYSLAETIGPFQVFVRR